MDKGHRIKQSKHHCGLLNLVVLGGALLALSGGVSAADIDARFDVRLLQDINKSSVNESSWPADFTQLGEDVYFTATTETFPFVPVGLWVTRGTSESTHPVTSTVDRLSIAEIKAVGDKLFLSADGDSLGRELWVFEPRSQSVSVVADIFPGLQGSFSESFYNLNDTLLFFADDGIHGYERWRSGGSANTTELLLDGIGGPQFAYPNPSVVTRGGLAYFVDFNASSSDTDYRMALWVSDGTASGTTPLVTLTDSYYLWAGGAVLFNDQICFLVRTFAEADLWCSDGTSAGTSRALRLSDLGLTPLLDSISVGPEGIYFVANSQEAGEELWVTDGTVAGTRLVSDLAGPFSSGVREVTLVGNTTYFVATDSYIGESKVWRVNEGATSIMPITSITDSPNEPRMPTLLTNFGGSLAFMMRGLDGSDQLWMYNKQSNELSKVAHFPWNASPVSKITALGQSLYFDANDGEGNEPWIWTNRKPQANDDTFRPIAGKWVTLRVLDNDSDVDGVLDPNSIEIIEPPSQGRVEVVAGGLRYKYNKSRLASDRFSYRVRDSQGGESNVAVVNLNAREGGGVTTLGLLVWLFVCWLLQQRTMAIANRN